MEVKLKYYFILTIDTYTKDRTIKSVKPDIVKYPKFWVTETEPEDDYVKKHRKYCGILNPAEAEEFLRDEFDSTQKTAGALTEHGHTPAVSFDSQNDSYNINAYVFPILDYKDEEILMKGIENHPQKEEVIELVRNEMDGALNKLLGFYDSEEYHEGKEILVSCFNVDTKQLFLENKPMEKLCPKCHKNSAEEPHSCPYQEDINNVEDDKYCTCCPECQSECRMGI